ncbi:glycosyltransferase involved in cell wall biosynthesis [Sphingomonas jinjuensis]|uniref:Glycosyltransferase involved in cell wall biosynthesis n=1 Tax=Sphingomonas jinjuensis TaxID=535907 RepID=A0A840FCB5_9SPHN|nr:glycosyltransferase family 4 protein [Sphingomonas jinjuensis]MBB4153886.1 glycosyltransferase involved in cell wall biosynthesis [Sphingomonas jinjuensis]
MRTIVLQRTVPHYRFALFDRLHDELGWVVATGGAGDAHGLHVPDADPPWLHRFAIRRHRARQYRATVPVDAILAALAPDAIVAEFSPQMSSSWRLSADRLLGRGGPRRLAYWSQGANVERGFRSPADLGAQALRLALMAPADAHLCYDGAGAAFLHRWLPASPPVFVAHNTLDPATLPGRGIDTSPADPAAAHLLFVGRLTRDKAVPDLVRAFALALADAPRLRLTIVGDGPDMAAVRTAAAPLGDAVRITGEVYDADELARYFQSASALVYAGGIGLAAVNALLYGVPVVLYDHPGADRRHHPEHGNIVDGVTGVRVAPTTLRALADQLVAIARASVPLRPAMRADIERYVAANLSLDRMVDGFRALDAHLRSIAR